MGLFSMFRKGSAPTRSSSNVRVRMLLSVDEYVAGEAYDIPVELADRFIIRGYAEGALSREYAQSERDELAANHQVVSLQMSAFWDKGLESFSGAAIDLSAATIKVRLLRKSAYTLAQTDQFLSALPAAIGTDVTLGTKVLSGGTFDAADAVFTAVAAGAAIDSLAIYKDTGVAGTSNLIAYIDGFSVTPNGGDITLQWQNSTPWIFKL